MERRTFVKLSAYTALALSVPLLNGCKPNATEQALSEPHFFSHITDLKTIRDTGEAYRKMKKDEDDKDKLVQILSGGDPSPDIRSIETSLNKQVDDDFKTGKVLVVNGWVLSITEARQCALLSILKS